MTVVVIYINTTHTHTQSSCILHLLLIFALQSQICWVSLSSSSLPLPHLTSGSIEFVLLVEPYFIVVVFVARQPFHRLVLGLERLEVVGHLEAGERIDTVADRVGALQPEVVADLVAFVAGEHLGDLVSMLRLQVTDQLQLAGTDCGEGRRKKKKISNQSGKVFATIKLNLPQVWLALSAVFRWTLKPSFGVCAKVPSAAVEETTREPIRCPSVSTQKHLADEITN